MKKKLLIFHPYLAPYRVGLYNRFMKDYEVEVLLTGAQPELDTLGFDLNYVNSQAEFNYEYYCDAHYIGRHPLSTIFWKKIKLYKPDIVLAHEYGINTLAAIAAKKFFGYKLFLTCDDSEQIVRSYSHSRDRLRKFVVKHSDGFVCVNPNVAKFLTEKYVSTECKFFYFPIIQNDIALAEKIGSSVDKAQEYIDKYNLGGKKILLFVGRLIDAKSPDLLIEAFSSFAMEDKRLVIVGSGEMEKSLKNQVEHLGINDKVIFTGSLSGKDLYAWYYLAHIFSLPSQLEPFGAVVNEALVAGCWTIVSNHCGSASLVGDSNGNVFVSGDLAGLKMKLKESFCSISINKQHVSRMQKPFEDYYLELKTKIND